MTNFQVGDIVEVSSQLLGVITHITDTEYAICWLSHPDRKSYLWRKRYFTDKNLVTDIFRGSLV